MPDLLLTWLDHQAEAPKEVIDALNRERSSPDERITHTKHLSTSTIPPSPPSSDSRPDQAEQGESKEREMLLMLQELIKRKLDVVDGDVNMAG